MIIKGIRAFIVCVNYSDFLSVTLPHNRKHFENIIIVTDFKDTKTFDLCQKEGVGCVKTDAFYDDGAMFNKWKALNHALEQFSYDRWICLLDADIQLPKKIEFTPISGMFYTPKRRVVRDITQLRVFEDEEFSKFPLAQVNEEFAGYCQFFDSNDPRLGSLPWHEQNWKHAGGADSFLWMKWPPFRRQRPPFEVLHFGEDGKNWGGRVTPMYDGTVLEGSEERRQKLTELLSQRRGRKGPERYKAEKL